jgi:hypothetical protein
MNFRKTKTNKFWRKSLFAFPNHLANLMRNISSLTVKKLVVFGGLIWEIDILEIFSKWSFCQRITLLVFDNVNGGQFLSISVPKVVIGRLLWWSHMPRAWSFISVWALVWSQYDRPNRGESL